MNWLSKHLNWAYTFELILGLIPLIWIGFLQNSATGYIIWIVILMFSSYWILRQKGRNYAYLILVIWAAAIAIPIILCLSNERKEKEIEI